MFSLRGFFETLLENQWNPTSRRELLDVYIALYDTLVDDDEDIRDQGAATVSLLLSNKRLNPAKRDNLSYSLSPPAAKHRLLLFLQETFRYSERMHAKAIEKMIGIKYPVENGSAMDNSSDREKIRLRPVAEIFADAQTPDTAVFVEERQNLYVDPVGEADAWANLLMVLDTDVCDASALAALETWTKDGLLHLLDTCKKQEDNSLGFTSDPDIHLLFMRTILAAKVLINVSTRTSAKWRLPGDMYRKLLYELQELGKEISLNGLLLEAMECSSQRNS